MPTIQGTDLFSHNNFTVPGGGPYVEVDDTPVRDSTYPYTDPYSVLFSDPVTGSALGSQMTAPPALGWHGFFWRLNTADKPVADKLIAQMFTSGFAQAAKIYFTIFANELSVTVGDVNFINVVAALDRWNWIEQIYDVSGATHTLYTRMNSVDFTPVSDSGGGAGTTAQYTYIGASAAITHRFQHHLWGSAASVTDWLGIPAQGSFSGNDLPIGILGYGAGW